MSRNSAACLLKNQTCGRPINTTKTLNKSKASLPLISHNKKWVIADFLNQQAKYGS